jgi:hypothetical protein
MSRVIVARGLGEFNDRGRGQRPRWGTWLGILASIVLFAAFCLWVYGAIQANDDARCRQAAADAASDFQAISSDDSRSDNSTASDDGDVCLVRRDAVAR